jgi:tRNA pseudouridine38-40 synthase
MTALERLKLIVAYDGRPFSGWQSQPNGNGIQDHLKRAFSQILSGPVKLHGAGRTDSGVHALGQVAHIEVPRQKLNPANWMAAVNAHLPAEIRVIQCQAASSDFHAQYSAVGKVYRYRIWNAQVFHPMEIGRSWHVPQALDLDRLRVACDRVTGTHDFASFAANRGKAPETTTRTIYRISIQRRKELIVLEFDGDGFLYRMVRMITGTIVRVASQRAEIDWIADLLANPGKTKTNCTAPAEGLYLVKVRYRRAHRRSVRRKARKNSHGGHGGHGL